MGNSEIEFKVPVLQIGNVVLTTVMLDLSDDQVVKFQHQIVNGIRDREAEGIVIDISSLDVVDSFMARVINDAAAACRLVGAEVVVSGIQPYVAMTLVEMGQLLNVSTTFNLEQALAIIKSKIDSRA